MIGVAMMYASASEFDEDIAQAGRWLPEPSDN